MRDPLYPYPQPRDLRALAEFEGPVISLFVPVTADVPDVAQNAVRHANIVSKGLSRSRDLGISEADLVEAAEALEEFSSETRTPAAGVRSRAAFWSSHKGLRRFSLPFAVQDTAQVACCAKLRPIARATRRSGRFRVLVLSLNCVALYEGNERELSRVSSDSLPDSLEDALGSELTEGTLQFHSTGRGGAGLVYHGQGGAAKERRIDVERFHSRVARGLEAEIGDDVVPLVLAADAKHRPGLESALRRDVGLVPKQLEGNAEHLSPKRLHDATWPLAAELHEGSRGISSSKSQPLRRISEIVSHATMGRIRTLWVPEFGEIPGRLDRDRARAVEARADDDLIEQLMAEVLRRGGRVEVLEGQTFSASSDGLQAQLW